LRTKIKRFLENQPGEVFTKPKHKLAAGVALFGVSTAAASSFLPKLEYFSIYLLLTFYLITRRVQLDPEEYCRLCEKELNKDLQTLEKLRMTGDKFLCKNPAVVGISYVAAVSLWALTKVEIIPFAVFCTMWGVLQGTETRLAYLPPETITHMKEAFQLAFANMSSEQLSLIPAETLTYLEQVLSIKPSPLDEQPLSDPPPKQSKEVSFTYSEALTVLNLRKRNRPQEQVEYVAESKEVSDPPPLPSSSGIKFFPSPEVAIEPATPSGGSGLNTAARAASFSLNLTRPLIS